MAAARSLMNAARTTRCVMHLSDPRAVEIAIRAAASTAESGNPVVDYPAS
jgi:hypothetical protein